MKSLILLLSLFSFPGKIILVNCEQSGIAYSEYTPEWGDHSFTEVIVFSKGQVITVDTVIGKVVRSHDPITTVSFLISPTEPADTCYWSFSYYNTDSSMVEINCFEYYKRARPGMGMDIMGRARRNEDIYSYIDTLGFYLDTINYSQIIYRAK